MISQSLSNFKSQISQKEDIGSYDNIALNQRSIYKILCWTKFQERLEKKKIQI